jgi:hypothetical protein
MEDTCLGEKGEKGRELRIHEEQRPSSISFARAPVKRLKRSQGTPDGGTVRISKLVKAKESRTLRTKKLPGSASLDAGGYV